MTQQNPAAAYEAKKSNRYRNLTLLVLVLGTALRLLLCWANPPDNTFDNHFRPISLILETGHIPAKNACFECYNPPVFYLGSALVAKLLFQSGATEELVTKALQLVNCLYGILTLPVIYLILRRFRLSDFSRLLTLGVICFLPRHIYMSAMHSNDGLTYLAVAVCAWLLLVAIDRELRWPWALVLGASLSLAIFVKYTAFVVLPMAALPLAALLIVGSELPRPRVAAALVLALLPPLLFLGSYMVQNVKDDGRLLPWNDNMFDTSVKQPRDPGGASLVNFKPWQFIVEPIVVPGQMQSFWTLVYCGTWFDCEPKFTNFTDRNETWWSQYCYWLGGKETFPNSAPPLSVSTRLLAGGLIAGGLVPLGLIFAGLFGSLRRLASRKGPGLSIESAKLLAFPTLFVFNAAGIVLLALKAPVYSSMKASYFLNSLPFFALFLALGLEAARERKGLVAPLGMALVLLMAFAALHVLDIAWSLLA